MGFLAVVLLFVGVATAAVWSTIDLAQNAPPDAALSADGSNSEEDGGPSDNGEAAGNASASGDRDSNAAKKASSGNEAAPDGSPGAAAYTSLVSGAPGEERGDLVYVQGSVQEPSKASVWFAAPSREGRSRFFVFFVERTGENGGWRSYRSVVAGDQEFPRDLETMIGDVPEDLRRPVLRTGQNAADASPTDVANTKDPKEAAVRAAETGTGMDGWKAGTPEKSGGFYRIPVSRATDVGKTTDTEVYLREKDGAFGVAGIGADLTAAELPGFPDRLATPGGLPDARAALDPAEPVYNGDAKSQLTRGGVEAAAKTVGDYPGVAGFYAMDPKDGSGFGIRPDTEFFSASTIKVAVMAAVYRKIDDGELRYSDNLTTSKEDWAAGAGWLRWNTPGAKTTVEDALWLMMTESDNVATNVLTRAVGGPDYVNAVARDLGARNTDLFWKLSSERAAVPALDNRTTPRDMATVLSGVYEGEGYSDRARDEMVDLMGQNGLEFWLEGGVPQGVKVANKGGWLDGTYNDVGIVRNGDKPYVLAIYTMYGPKMEVGSPVLAEISGDVWLAETGETKKEAEARTKKQNAPKDKPTQKPANGN